VEPQNPEDELEPGGAGMQPSMEEAMLIPLRGRIRLILGMSEKDTCNPSTWEVAMGGP
jgi:hypothetical protein